MFTLLFVLFDFYTRHKNNICPIALTSLFWMQDTWTF